MTTSPKKKLPDWFSTWTAMFAIIIGAALLSLRFGELVGDLVVLAGLAAVTYYRYRRRRAIRCELFSRLETRMIAALDEALAHQPFQLLKLSEWDMERLADWPDSKECPAPIAVFEVVVKTEGSEPETLMLLLDPRMLVLPVLADLSASPVRACPRCDYGDLSHDADGVAHQFGASTKIWFYTWRCDQCDFTERADLLGNPEPASVPGEEHELPNNICRPRSSEALQVQCEIGGCEEMATYDCYPAVSSTVTPLEITIALCEGHARDVDPALQQEQGGKV